MRVPRVQAQRPRQKKICRSRSQCARWSRTNWSACSTKCGLGEQTRQIRCQLRHSRKVVPNSKCAPLTRPKLNRRCRSREDCENAAWFTLPYGPCSQTCSDRAIDVYQSRQIHCKYKTSDIPDAFCSMVERPADQQLCTHLPPCNPPAVWKTSDWGPCSVTCGRGIMLRNVDCTGTSCSDPKPETTQVCDLGSCKAGNCKDIQRLRKQTLNGNYYIEVKLCYIIFLQFILDRGQTNSSLLPYDEEFVTARVPECS